MNPKHPLSCGAPRLLLALIAAALVWQLSACSRDSAQDTVPPASEASPSVSRSAQSEESIPDASQNAGTDGEIITIEAFDGIRFDGKLRLPVDANPGKLVIFVNGSGPNTYDNKRDLSETETFRYFDLFAREITKRGAAFFSYNTRGVTPGDTPPLYSDIDENAYQTYIPSNEVRDVETIIRQLSSDERLKGCKIYLLGWSAGTIVAPLVAKSGEVQVDALLLAGYCNRTMADVLDWQQTGGSSMVNMRRFFDYDGDGAVTKEEVDEDRYQVKPALGVASFEELDTDNNGSLEPSDFELLLAPGREALYKALNENDDAWLRDNYPVRITSAWFNDYRRIASNSETLPTLSLPVYIFQGGFDANTPVEDSYAIEKAFQEAGKTNLKLQVFPDHDHDLNYVHYLTAGELPDGLKAIFDAIESL